MTATLKNALETPLEEIASDSTPPTGAVFPESENTNNQQVPLMETIEERRVRVGVVVAEQQKHMFRSVIENVRGGAISDEEAEELNTLREQILAKYSNMRRAEAEEAGGDLSFDRSRELEAQTRDELADALRAYHGIDL